MLTLYFSSEKRRWSNWFWVSFTTRTVHAENFRIINLWNISQAFLSKLEIAETFVKNEKTTLIMISIWLHTFVNEFIILFTLEKNLISHRNINPPVEVIHITFHLSLIDFEYNFINRPSRQLLPPFYENALMVKVTYRKFPPDSNRKKTQVERRPSCRDISLSDDFFLLIMNFGSSISNFPTL